jgi:hypothetical protein
MLQQGIYPWEYALPRPQSPSLSQFFATGSLELKIICKLRSALAGAASLMDLHLRDAAKIMALGRFVGDAKSKDFVS